MASFRPLSLDLSVVSYSDSGYSTAQNSTESEHAPFDWDAVRDKLHDYQDCNATLVVTEPIQYMLTECSFTLQIGGVSSMRNYRDIFDSIKAVVLGPSGNSYATRTVIESKDSAKIHFRPLESGPFQCYVEMGSNQCLDPPQIIIEITRQFVNTTRPILTMDIELPEENKDKMEKCNPWGICSNLNTEQLYVADRENNQIVVFSPDGELDFRFGGKGSLPGSFFRPTGVAYDQFHDRILVTDKDNHRIQVFTPQGHYLTQFGRRGKFDSQFFFPWGIAVARNGLIAIADSRNHRIQLFDSNFNFIRKHCAKDKTRNGFKHEFDYPRGLCFEHKGENLFVTDFNLHCLFKLDIKFTVCEALVKDDKLKRPQGMSLDHAGNILLCDSKHNSVKMIRTDGKIIADIQLIGNFELPLDVTCMKGGHLAVLDMNGRIRVF